MRGRAAFLGLLGIVWAAAGCAVNGTPTETPTPTATPAGPSGNQAADDSGQPEAEAYLRLIDRVMQDTGQAARVLSQVGVHLASSPEAAPEAADVVQTAKETLEASRADLGRASPPQGLATLQRQLLDALDLYVQAADALLPDAETSEADYWRFQELMPEAGKRFHGAGATLSEAP